MHLTRHWCSPAKAGRYYALDLEFIKTRHRFLVRSFALVPFGRETLPSASPAAPPLSTAESSSSSSGGGAPLPRLTRFVGPATVLELSPAVTLSQAVLLPCGHLLRERSKARFGDSPAVAAVLAEFRSETMDSLQSYRSVRKAVVELEKKTSTAAPLSSSSSSSTSAQYLEGAPEDGAGQLSEAFSSKAEEEDGREAGDDDDSAASTTTTAAPAAASSSSSAPPVTHDLLSPSSFLRAAESAVMSALQRRVSLVYNFRGLDPFSIPNIRVCDRAALRLLHSAPVDSPDFNAAKASLKQLNGYGKGKGGFKTLSELLQGHPIFLQRVLQAAFDSPTAWCDWLQECHDAVEHDMIRCYDGHRAQSLQCPRRSGDHGDGDDDDRHDRAKSGGDGAAGAAGLLFTECTSIEDLAHHIRQVWATILRPAGTRSSSSTTASGSCTRSGGGGGEGTHEECGAAPKVFVYGNADQAVLHRTLELCQPPPSISLHLSERGMKAGRFYRRLPADDTDASPSAPPADHRSSQWMSAYEARVVDVTQHPLFSAAGFTLSPRRVPNLSRALEKAASRDAVAAALLASPQQHDPLWDAQALACVCAVSGVVR